MTEIPAEFADRTSRWQPSATVETARERARLLDALRRFFAERGVLEVDTPVAVQYPSADAHVASLRTALTSDISVSTLYLRTSPEHAMKRLLAAGFGPMYQIGKVFRDGEAGRLHNPEFTLVEWYRPGWDHRRLMSEVGELISTFIPSITVHEMALREAFRRWAAIDPWDTDSAALRKAVLAEGGPSGLDFDACLDFLLSARVQKGMRADFPGSALILHGYPASQAALARIVRGDEEVAARFELFIDGTELANGYWELTDHREQRERFEQERTRRRRTGEHDVPPDEHLLAALAAGMPECAGVALGLERLHMAVYGYRTIEDVISFPTPRA